MSTYLIPDVHENLLWAQQILDSKAPQDTAVFLGDYFHQYNQDNTAAVCRFLQSLFGRTDVVLLLGNHDLAHIGASIHVNDYLCSGWTIKKQMIFQAMFPDMTEFISHFRVNHWLHFEDKSYLLTHAGLTNELVYFWQEQDRTPSFIGNTLLGIHHQLLANVAHPWLLAGQDRGGSEPAGGITWCDWTNFEPIPGILQICGHTPGSEPREKAGNWCIDCNQSYYAVLDDVGNLEFRRP